MTYNDLPRVTSLVEFMYPFDDRFFKSWLHEKEIDHSDYMELSCEWWTAIHQWVEDYLMKKRNKRQLMKDEPIYCDWISSGIDFIKDYKVKKAECEVYVKNNYYQWTADCICTINGDRYVLDWKTFGLAKYIMIENKVTKPRKKKLEKVALQLSLYNVILKADKIAAVHLTPEWYWFYELDLVPMDDIKELIKKYRVVNGLYTPTEK